MMHGHEKSSSAIVAVKPANKAKKVQGLRRQPAVMVARYG